MKKLFVMMLFGLTVLALGLAGWSKTHSHLEGQPEALVVAGHLSDMSNTLAVMGATGVFHLSRCCITIGIALFATCGICWLINAYRTVC